MTIQGQTNVLSSRFGSGSVDGLAREFGRFVVTTMPIPWEITKDRLGGTPEEILFVESMEQDIVDRQVASAPPCDTVVAIGGGQAIDLGKYFSWKRKVRLVSIPTVVSVDAFTTPAAAIRHNHRVEYVGAASPDPLVIDYDLIRTAPPILNIAGAGDLLSIHTASRDWEIAHHAGKDKFEFSVADIASAREILGSIVVNADEIRRVTDKGLLAIVEGYIRLNTICLPAGHFRVEEGSEHFLFYELEERLGKPFIHGQIIGLGIYLLSRLQGNQPDDITRVMDGMELDYQPVSMGIDRPSLEAALRNLKSFVRARDLWPSVIDEVPITDAWIKESLAGLTFA